VVAVAITFEQLAGLAKKRCLVMGILNITPDSFSDGGRLLGPQDALALAKKMAWEGADALDIGGESTKPGAEAVSVEVEMARIMPVLELLSAELPDMALSVDTMKAPVAKAALSQGVCLVNDVSALGHDPGLAVVVAESRAGICLMHRLSEASVMPWSTQESSRYGSQGVLLAVSEFLRSRAALLHGLGVPRERVWVDPGFGFNKTVEENFSLLKHLGEFKSLGYEVLIGPSRKSSLGAALGGLPVEERLEGTAAAVAASILAGAACVRVHDVKEMARVAKVAQAIKNAK
jgi:dihydropteroate synthase